MMRRINPHLAVAESRTFASEIIKDAQRMHLDPRFVMAIVTVESGWNKRAVSHAGALGLGQLMPSTAAQLHVNPGSARGNLLGTSTYLGRLVTRFSKSPNQYRFAIAGYNAGPMAVVRYGGVPPYGETKHYVVKVLRVWQHLKSRLGSPILIASPLAPHKTLRIVPDYWNPAETAIAPATQAGAPFMPTTAVPTVPTPSAVEPAAEVAVPRVPAE